MCDSSFDFLQKVFKNSKDYFAEGFAFPFKYFKCLTEQTYKATLFCQSHCHSGSFVLEC